MDYHCGKFGFSRFGSVVQTVTDAQADADERFTAVTLVGVSS